MKGLKQMPSFFLNSMQTMTTVPNLEALKIADIDNNEKECQPAEIKEWNLLHSAAQGGDVSIIEMVLSLGIDVNSKDSLDTTPLMVAAAKGKKQAVDFLLTKGADPSLRTLKGRNLLHAAVEGGDVSIVETVLSLGIPVDSIDKGGLTPLMIAVSDLSNNKLEALEFLLSNGADPLLKNENGRNVLFISAQCGCTDVIQRLLSFGLDIDSRDYEGHTSLMCAAALAKSHAVNCFLANGANPTLTANNGWSLLHFACQGGNTAIIETFLSCGLDVNIKDTYTGLTPLAVSILCKKLDAIKYLLQKGADPLLELGILPVNMIQLMIAMQSASSIDIIEACLSNGLDINVKTREGLTPLMTAAYLNNPSVVDFLLLKGADPSLRDNSGRTVLHYAAEGGDITVIEKCLSRGLDIESKDREGKTPIMLAASSVKTEAVKYLLQRSLNNQGI